VVAAAPIENMPRRDANREHAAPQRASVLDSRRYTAVD
jgi:hypothetical protein